MASPTVTTQNVITSNTLPDWYVNYLSPLMQRAVGQVNEPYQKFGAPRVAGLTPDQQRAYDLVNQSVYSQTPYIQQALDYTNQAAGVDSGAAGADMFGGAADFFNQSAAVNSGAAGAGQFGEAGDIFGRVAGSDTTGISSPFVNQGTGYLSQAAQGSSLGAANPYISQSVAPTGLAAASPYLGAAGQSWPGAAGAYMSPYITAVTDRIAQLGGRNLSENLLPQISDQFVRSGQYGSPQQRDLIGRALRDTQESVLGQQSQALERGYGQAGQLFGQDQARYAQLAGTAGGLGTSQQQILQGAGSTLGNLSATDLSRLAAAGVNIGNLGIAQAGVAGSDYQRQLQAGQGMFGIGAANIQAAQADAQRQLQAGQGLYGIGQSQIGAAQNDAARKIGAGQQIMDLSKYGLDSTFRTAGALEGIGAAQQAQTQRNYDTAYGDFQEQRDYPWQQIGRASNVLQGVPINTSSTQQSQTTTPGPSTISQIAGLGLGVAGLANSGIFRAKGGKVVKYKRSHSYGNVPKRGIAFAEAA